MFLGRTKNDDGYVLITYYDIDDFDITYNDKFDCYEVDGNESDSGLVSLSQSLGDEILRLEHRNKPEIGGFVELDDEILTKIKCNKISSFSATEDSLFKSCIN